MKISWGWKVGLLYGSFVVLMLALVFAANHQHFDLVSKDYYDAEVGYQKVIDAGKNQSALSKPLAVHANETSVFIDFPDEFKYKKLAGMVLFYSPVNSEWDYNFRINTADNSITVPRTALHNTRYTIKINCVVDGKNYYQESEIYLHS